MNTAESWLGKTLQYRFKNTELFQQALTHRSASSQNNERLEFLGDSVLNVAISDIIYRVRPDASEGDLSRLRASMVKDEALAELAMDLELGNHLILGSGERKTGGHHRHSILADALEAIFGAVYLDGGFASAMAVIELAYAARVSRLPDAGDLRDPKTRLQEWLQARKMEPPIYELVGESGKDHRKIFDVSCTVEPYSAVTRGESTSRRKAEQIAARAMYRRISESDR